MTAAFPHSSLSHQITAFVPTVQLYGVLRKTSKSESLLNEDKCQDFRRACDFWKSPWLKTCNGVYDDDPTNIVGWSSFKESGLEEQVRSASEEPDAGGMNAVQLQNDAITNTISTAAGQEVLSYDPHQELFCFLLSSYQVRSSLAYGCLRGTHSVYEVLYLRLLRGREMGSEVAMYRRAGVGNIIQKSFFKNLKEVELILG